MNGIQAFIEMLAQFGVKYIFGNPGTSELPLNDALVTDKRIQYILGLQEVPVMGIADGYSMASGNIGVVNLHISCGLGNAMGILYNAYREGTPLLVTAGQQDRRLRFEEPILYGDMVSVAKPWTKWSYEVERIEELAGAIRRAVQLAMTPPTGPVFLSLPMDLQLENADGCDLAPIRLLDTRVRPPQNAVRDAAKLLLESKRLAILAGSRVMERSATDELVSVAETLGAPVISEPGTTHGRLAFPPRHPLSSQGLPLWSPEVRRRLDEFDTLFVVGMDLLRQYVYQEPSRAIPEHIRVVHLDEDAWQLGKNYPVEVGLLGDTKAGLHQLNEELVSLATPVQLEAMRKRRETHEETHRQDREAFESKVQLEMQRCQQEKPISSLALMGAVAQSLPPNAAVIEAAVTTTNTTLERLGALDNVTGYFGHRGWTLGWGLGVTIGVKLAWPDRPVLGVLGEGAAMYGIQGLWTAARFNIPAVFLICNNAQYQILKIGAKGLSLPNAMNGHFDSLDIAEPEIDFVTLSRSLGVDAETVTTPGEVTEAIRSAFAAAKPMLINVPIERSTPNRLNYG